MESWILFSFFSLGHLKACAFRAAALLPPEPPHRIHISGSLIIPPRIIGLCVGNVWEELVINFTSQSSSVFTTQVSIIENYACII